MLLSKIRTLFSGKLSYTLYSLLAVLFLASCEDPSELGLELVEDNISGKYTDTVTVNVSTLLVDSIATSGTGMLLAGQYTTPQTGTLNASTYFQIGLGTSSFNDDAAAAFDSIKLILPFSGYYYGDTTKAITYNVHELASDLRLRELSPVFPNEQPLSTFYQNSALYNVSRVAVKEEPLATFSFLPRPASQDTIKIKLPNELGKQWFDLLMADDSKLTEVSTFLSYFKGISIRPAAGSTVLGYSGSGTLVRLYYTAPNSSGFRTKQFYDFPLTNSALQYNRFTSDFTGSALEGLERGKALPANSTNGVSVAQAGTGLIIKLDFPYLERLTQQVNPDFINKAVLEIEPYRGTTTTYPYPVPPSIGLYATNTRNNLLYAPVAVDYDVKGTPLTSSFLKNNETGAIGRYQFSITEFLINKLKDPRTTKSAIYLAPALGTFNNTVNRLVVAAQNKEIKNVRLKIYYTTIK